MSIKEYPILFSEQMVLTILDGRKTQTRRVIKSEWSRCLDLEEPVAVMAALFQCPYGHPGERLWVREAWRPIDDDMPVSRLMPGDTIYYRADYVGEALEGKWRPSIHMPRWASRIMLEIVNVRVEQVQEIKSLDAISEGAIAWFMDHKMNWKENKKYPYPIYSFMKLWNSINAKRGYSWESNPWVWVIEFKRIEES